MNPLADYDLGAMVFSRELLINDGGIPEIDPDAILAEPGQRGVVINFGHTEADPDQVVYLVRFEFDQGVLGPPIGCLPEELTQDEGWAKAQLTSASTSAR